MDKLTWVRNFGTVRKPSRSATSLWHLLHSVRMGRDHGFALTYCGQFFTNPRARYDLKAGSRKCLSCHDVSRALATTAEISDDLVIREG